MALPADIPRRLLSTAEFERIVQAGVFAESERIALIDGEMIVTPPQGPEHASLTTKLMKRLQRAYGDDHDVRVSMPLILDDGSEPEPDLVVVRGSFSQRHPRGDEATLVIEVAKTSLTLDHEMSKRYARAVAVYWIVDVNARCIEVYTDPIASESRYVTCRVLTGSQTVTPPGLDARWTIAELLVAT